MAFNNLINCPHDNIMDAANISLASLRVSTLYFGKLDNNYHSGLISCNTFSAREDRCEVQLVIWLNIIIRVFDIGIDSITDRLLEQLSLRFLKPEPWKNHQSPLAFRS